MYKVRLKNSIHIIGEFETYVEAVEAIVCYVRQDEKDGIYEIDAYEII